MYYNVPLRRLRENIVAVGKKNNITYSACVFVALSNHKAMRVGHIITCGLLGSSTFFHFTS